MSPCAHKECSEGTELRLQSCYQECRRVLGGAGNTCEECGDHEELIIGRSLSRFLNHTTQERSQLTEGAACLCLLTSSCGRLAGCPLE